MGKKIYITSEIWNDFEIKKSEFLQICTSFASKSQLNVGDRGFEPFGNIVTLLLQAC